MKQPIWLDRTDCLALHEMMLAQHGGRAGVRDEGLLESALAKPQIFLPTARPRFRKWRPVMRRALF